MNIIYYFNFQVRLGCTSSRGLGAVLDSISGGSLFVTLCKFVRRKL
jgi:hypothetical protein